MQPQILVHVVRGETVESVHRGHIHVCDGDGNTLVSLGSSKTVTFFRSASKPIQAIPLITSGAADAFGFSEEEIALACASHSGESRHVRIAQLMIERIGLSESHLRCGVHLPFFEKEAERMLRAGEHPTQFHNNCSGKHAAMLATAKHTGADLATYDEIENPVQQAILGEIARFTGSSTDEIAVAVDGCAAPNFAVPVAAMATSIANLISPPAEWPVSVRSACERIVAAMVKFPELIGGSERLDTMLMQAAGGSIISKVGADGVWLCGVLPGEKWPTGLGIALKVEDGDDKRARPVIAVEMLRQLGILDGTVLEQLSPMPLINRRGEEVGRVSPIFKLDLQKY